MNIHTLIHSNPHLNWASSSLNPEQLTRLITKIGGTVPSKSHAAVVEFSGNYLVATASGRAFLGLSRADAGELFSNFNWSPLP